MADTLAEVTEEVKQKSRTPTQEIFRHLFKHSSGRAGIIILSILILIAIFAPWIAPYDPIAILRDVDRRDTPCIHILGCPADQPEHIFGIDGNSRDLYSRIIYGSRLSLQVGIITMGFAILIERSSGSRGWFCRGITTI